jgi:hypothetical protein
MLHEKGVSESVLNIMEEMNQALDAPIQNQKYAEYLTMYVVLRPTAKSHGAAVATLDGVLREVGLK